MTQSITKELIGLTVEEAVEELIKQGYSKEEAIKIIRENYKTKGGFKFSLVMVHILSVLLLLTLLYPSDSFMIIRMLIGFPYITFLPGYSLLLSLYKDDIGELNNLSKFGLSLGISFAIIVLVGLLLNFTIGLDQLTILVSGIIITELFAIYATIRG
ncbi:DUF1616 domain-containing protein [Stygiolobus caldivivus]|uniref:DUF1616 domain-containing protein n=1 Tax=Stygiolobus caldivivus TaxID=2824673 RepID=A0A8D5U4T1_9CREN|nr:DUF1616 domain-containing protein [Stygiolobus caldivivus]BCU69052.1 hypothetical protein KN1_03490 [Stygiolobus caldivivus]